MDINIIFSSDLNDDQTNINIENFLEEYFIILNNSFIRHIKNQILSNLIERQSFLKYNIQLQDEINKYPLLNNEKIDSIIKKELKNKFSPEFLNRLDDIVLFDQLSEDNILKIVEVELKDFTERMLEIDIEISLDEASKKFLAKEGYEPAYGARPLKRAIQNHVEDLLADAIIKGEVKKGSKVKIVKKSKDNKLSIK